MTRDWFQCFSIQYECFISHRGRIKRLYILISMQLRRYCKLCQYKVPDYKFCFVFTTFNKIFTTTKTVILILYTVKRLLIFYCLTIRSWLMKSLQRVVLKNLNTRWTYRLAVFLKVLSQVLFAPNVIRTR